MSDQRRPRISPSLSPAYPASPTAAFQRSDVVAQRNARKITVLDAANTVSVRRSMLPDGTAKAPKSAAGVRTIPLLPALRRLLVAWKVRSPRAGDDDLVICTHDGGPVMERNLRRPLDAAKEAAGMDGGEERLSWHSLRHSFASMLATDLELPATTLARIVGHADAGFSLKVYARDARDDDTLVIVVFDRAATAQIGG